MSVATRRSIHGKLPSGLPVELWVVDTVEDAETISPLRGDLLLVSNSGVMYKRDINQNGWTLTFDPAELVGEIDAEDVVGLQATVEGFLTDELAGKANLSHAHAQSEVTGLVDALSGKAPTIHTHAIADTTGLQTDLDFLADSLDGKEPANANIQAHIGAAHAPSNAQKNSDITLAEIEAKLVGEISSHTHAGGPGGAAWGDITGTLADQTDLQTALDAKQPLDSDLTSIAALSATTDNFMVAAASAWASRTPAQAKTSLGLVKADVGLGSVDNTTDAGKPVSTATQTALDLKAPIASPSFTGATLTLANAQDIVINATTGTKVGQSGSKIGFFGVTPVVRPTALTQTYSTASATHANVTSLAAPAGGTGATAGAYNTAANRDLMIVSQNAMRTDIANLKNFVNQIVDQLQAQGLLQ